MAENTVATYAYRLIAFWQWLQYRELRWVDIGLNELADFAHWYLMGGEIEVISECFREITSKRSPRTVNQAVTVIQGFYEFHAVEGRVDEKRFVRLTYGFGKRNGFLKGIVKETPEKRKRIKLKEPRIFPGCLSEEETTRLVNACFTYRDRLIVMLLRETGVRRGELLGLHLKDVHNLDIKGRILIIRRQNPNGAWVKGIEREIPVLHNRQAVQSTFEAYLTQEYPLEAERQAHGMLFVTLQGKTIGHPMTFARVYDLFDGLHSRTGIKANPHLFRHTFATRMLQAGYQDGYVQQLLGHRSIATTKDIYSHVLDELNLNTMLEGEKENVIS